VSHTHGRLVALTLETTRHELSPQTRARPDVAPTTALVRRLDEEARDRGLDGSPGRYTTSQLGHGGCDPAEALARQAVMPPRIDATLVKPRATSESAAFPDRPPERHTITRGRSRGTSASGPGI